MTTSSHEGQLVDAFATLADTLVDDYDVVDLLHTLVDTCHDVLDITAAGILLADEHGQLEVLASTSEASNLVEVMQIDAQAGPCFDCFTTGEVVSLPNIDVAPSRWPQFRATAAEQGFGSVFAVPMRLRSTVIGTLNLLRNERGDMDSSDLRAARALADVATIGILQERALRDSSIVRQQLQNALETRIVIEQAKGVIAYSHRVSTAEAFALIRGYARRHQELLATVAQRLVDGTLTLGDDIP